MSLRTVVTALATFALASLSAAQTTTSMGVEKPSSAPTLGGSTVHGCYSNIGQLHLNDTYLYNAQGWCGPLCYNASYPVAASYGQECYCGDKYPNSAYVVSDSKCDEPCPGYGTDACGGLGTFTVYNTGIIDQVAESDEGASASSSASSSKSTTSAVAKATTAPTVDPESGATTTVTAAASPAAASDTSSSKGSSNSTTIGIAVGVVVGGIALVSIGAGIFFCMRRKKNSEIEEEHRRNAAVNAFISGGKPPGSSGGMSMADSRMDPVMHRRGSDGSIADNQDYSRRILRVTNA